MTIVFGFDITILALVALVMLSAGGIAYTFLFDRADTENKLTDRINRIADTGQKAAVPEDGGSRRKNVQNALKEFEIRQKAKEKQSKNPPLSMRLQQAGLSWTKNTYVIISLVCGVVIGFLAWSISDKPLVGIGGVVAGGVGLPWWIVGYLRNRRQNAFLKEFPNAVDLIVRGIRSGLPLGDCIRMIATETQEPVASEFRQIIESTQLGLSVSDACLKLFDRMPVQEANFFGIVISIQQKAGGNLSEALSNLSKVLRDRKKMKQKVAAMSMEAKASASIIGALPFIVCGLIYLVARSYLMLLFTTNAGNTILIGSLLYMSIGVFVMAQMIKFDI